MMKKLTSIVLHYVLPLFLFTASGGIIAFVVLRARPDVLGVTTSVNPVSELITEVSKHISVPSDEEPTVATITDMDKLPHEPIFQKAQIGDKVIAYAVSKKIILYRPSEKKVIDIGTFDLQEETSTPSASVASVIPNVTQVLLLYEASQSAQLHSFESELKQTSSNLLVVSKQSVFKQQPTETLVVDLTGNNSELVKKIAIDFHFVASLWPSGETKPTDGDVAIIWKSSP